MARVQMEAFIREAIEDEDRDRVVRRIADYIDDEIEAAFDRGVDAGREAYKFAGGPADGQ